ncbi:MAG: T9SS type A sorting domain-containing protein [Bacteroidales bacterium]|nr:T9SS type A sorting domain-containing protein [Bacteroidales bacterium]
MKHLKLWLSVCFVSVGIVSLAGEADTVFYEFWDINSLTTIGGHGVTVYGEPSVIATEKGNAVFFDGVNDALIIDKNPFGDTKAFTFEVLFKPEGGQPNITNEPRFVCFWDPEDADGPRMTIEIRVTASNEWYFDGYLKTDKEGLTLIDETKTHPTSRWMHAAVTYKDNIFTTYVNGQQELSGTVSYTSKVFNSTGKTSVGARYNLARWYNGVIRAIKVSHDALTPEEFFSVPDTNATLDEGIVHDGNAMEIYPVPAKNELWLRNFAGNDIPQSVSVTSMTGQIVYQSYLADNDVHNSPKLDVSDLPNGIYFVGLQYQNYWLTRKICIMH